ncbi:hypothetical protein ACFOG5_07770 [Pedobacter fastidiosus]|uniref:Uncharacterized protein n=1 Tax=Pedobacter fastidiosus TaxID=2765361 RepID=A0ABR7KPD8_9SPHI|nr:hypothetical protein [Pedobacter fastidiosus]MBC6109947.1 hypothetical protein [Pedobacter fastidiosus]
MKKITLLLALILIYSLCFGQIKKLEIPKKELIGKIAPGGNSTISIECYKYEDSTYLFRYLDAKFSRITEWKQFSIKSTEDLNTLYSYLQNGFKEMPKENVLLDIGNGYLLLNFSKFLGGKVVRIYHSTTLDENGVVGYTNMYTVKQIDKLFGKE